MTLLSLKNRPVISYVFHLNAKWPIKSWSTNYKKKSSFNFVKYVKKKKKIFHQKLTFFTQISKCSTDTILHHPDSELAGQIQLKNDKNIPCSPHFHLSWQFCRTNRVEGLRDTPAGAPLKKGPPLPKPMNSWFIKIHARQNKRIGQQTSWNSML